MKVSLLMTYRQRNAHLKKALEWFNLTRSLNADIELILIESDEKQTLDPESFVNNRVRYFFVPIDKVFHKSKLLNIGLAHSTGTFVVPYDVDNIPRDMSFRTHLKLVEPNRNLLFAGYRLMSAKETIDLSNMEKELLQTEPPEEDISFYYQRMQLLTSARFGIHPFFLRSGLEKINGWDENYKGWGAEDNDVIERYLETNQTFMVKSPDMVYLHLYHDKIAGWNEEFYMQKNFKHYHQQRGIEVDF